MFNYRLLLCLPLFYFLILSCSTKECPAPDMSGPITAQKYLALGDSYTIGQGVDPNERWPVQLAALLGEEDIEIDSLRIIAQTGWTTLNLKTAIAAAQPLEDYDLVSLLIGVNDQFQGGSVEDYTENFEELLDIVLTATSVGGDVIVVSIPDYGVTPFGQANSVQIAQELDDFNAVAEAICAERDIPFIDVTEISRTLGASEGALAPDNLHPSGLQYTEWAQAILPIAAGLFQ